MIAELSSGIHEELRWLLAESHYDVQLGQISSDPNAVYCHVYVCYGLVTRVQVFCTPNIVSATHLPRGGSGTFEEHKWELVNPACFEELFAYVLGVCTEGP